MTDFSSRFLRMVFTEANTGFSDGVLYKNVTLGVDLFLPDIDAC